MIKNIVLILERRIALVKGDSRIFGFAIAKKITERGISIVFMSSNDGCAE